MYTLSDRRKIGVARGGTIILVGLKRRRAKTGPLFESPPRPLVKSGLQPLGRYVIHQETISRRPEQMYTLFDTRLEWLGVGLLL